MGKFAYSYSYVCLLRNSIDPLVLAVDSYMLLGSGKSKGKTTMAAELNQLMELLLEESHKCEAE